LYARKRAKPADSMTLVLRRPNPINVKKMRAATAAPNKVADNGVMAAAGYAWAATILIGSSVFSGIETYKYDDSR
jgi:hypothetical protein